MTLPLRLRIMILFGLHAMLVGGLFARLAEVQRALGLSEQMFGLALAALPIGGFAGTIMAPGLAERHGTRRLMLAFYPLAAIIPALVGAAAGFAGLFAGLFAFGLVLAATSIASNVEADRVALATNAPLIARSHGTWGIGFLVSSLLSALAIRAGISPMQQFWVMAAVLGLGASIIIWPLRQSPPRPHKRNGPQPRIALPDRTTWTVLGFALSGMVLEGVTRNWSVIYLRDAFGATDWVAALALPAFVITQTMGRFATDPLAARFGDAAFSRALSACALLGLVGLIFTGSIWVALLACAVIGLGCASTMPMATVAIARDTARPSAESVAAFAIVQSGVGLAAPVIYGLAAGAVDHRFALALLMPLPVLAWLWARKISAAPLASV